MTTKADSTQQPKNAFIGRSTAPGDADLESALGSSKRAWDELLTLLAERYGVAVHEWKSYSSKSGWALRLLRGKRTIVWMAPCEGRFQVAFILGDKAMLAARQCGLPARVVQALDEAPRYPEGTGLRLMVKSTRDLAAIGKLAVVKLEN